MHVVFCFCLLLSSIICLDDLDQDIEESGSDIPVNY